MSGDHRESLVSLCAGAGFARIIAFHERKDISDPLIFDPAEELTRQDLAVLLDRAMSYLPAGTRKALELCYLVELPPNEAAARLGLTLNALEVRLHRARRQLRQVLNGELRANAESFGLALDKDATTGWRETSLWCYICGRQHLVGIFEPLPDGGANLRLRCPACSSPCNIDIATSAGCVPLGNLRSFRPAWRISTMLAVLRRRNFARLGNA